ncbi:MAG: hypothetical protein D3906_15990, partial [Candidatus Electrothrix sp. AUS1_2]|nr:hypothetical protein [Candidatus Electrothrix sp. AUS1_2]
MFESRIEAFEVKKSLNSEGHQARVAKDSVYGLNHVYVRYNHTPVSEVEEAFGPASPPSSPIQYLAGLDKLKVSLHLDWKGSAFLPMLSDFREQLRMSEKDHIPCDSIEFIDGMRFNMRPYGASKYPYVLDSGDITLLFSNHKPGAQFPNCRIEIGSMSCWHPGWLDLYEKITGWLRDQGAVIEQQKVTEFHITADLLGLRFEDSGFANRKQWIARCKKGGQAFENWVDNYISLGKGDFMFRCYNKTAELDPASAKYDFFHDLWRD